MEWKWERNGNSLEDAALLGFLLLDLQRGLGGGLEHLPDALLALGGALQVGEGVDLVGHGAALLGLHGFLLHLAQLPHGGRVVPQVLQGQSVKVSRILKGDYEKMK